MRGPRNHGQEHLAKIREHIYKINAKRTVVIEVLDIEKNIKIEYPSIRAASRELNCAEITIKRYLNFNKPFKGRYVFSSKNHGG